MTSDCGPGTVDVIERGDALVVRICLPGAPLESIHVEVSDNDLVVAYGRFFRRIALPAGAWVNKASETIVGGVLEIRVPLAVDDATEFGVPVPLPTFGLGAA